MYRPSRLNLTSEMDEMISEKNDRLAGSSSSSNTGIRKEWQDVNVGHVAYAHMVGKGARTFRVSIAQCRVTHVGKFDVRF